MFQDRALEAVLQTSRDFLQQPHTVAVSDVIIPHAARSDTSPDYSRSHTKREA